MSERRLFFALWPDERARDELMRNAAAVTADIRHSQPGVRCYSPGDIHLTLAFIGPASATYQACLTSAARQVSENEKIQPFLLEISRLGYFERAGILWAGCQLCPAPLAHLQATLVMALAACGYQAESRAFKPHVTLARKVGKPQSLPSFRPVLWQVNGFCLAESLPVTEGPRYRVIEEFQFAV
ncbi:MAG TPA: RNA 2',3'-cyclic phosphodiesterase [Gammaproteobacteria bacterium]